MRQNVKRVSLVGSGYNEIEFVSKATQYIVKNFGTNPIYVTFDSEVVDDENIKINGGYFQIVGDIEPLIDKGTDTIYIKGTASDEVEVMQLCQ